MRPSFPLGIMNTYSTNRAEWRGLGNCRGCGIAGMRIRIEKPQLEYFIAVHRVEEPGTGFQVRRDTPGAKGISQACPGKLWSIHRHRQALFSPSRSFNLSCTTRFS